MVTIAATRREVVIKWVIVNWEKPASWITLYRLSSDSRPEKCTRHCKTREWQGDILIAAMCFRIGWTQVESGDHVLSCCVQWIDHKTSCLLALGHHVTCISGHKQRHLTIYLLNSLFTAAAPLTFGWMWIRSMLECPREWYIYTAWVSMSLPSVCLCQVNCDRGSIRKCSASRGVDTRLGRITFKRWWLSVHTDRKWSFSYSKIDFWSVSIE